MNPALSRLILSRGQKREESGVRASIRISLPVRHPELELVSAIIIPREAISAAFLYIRILISNLFGKLFPIIFVPLLADIFTSCSPISAFVDGVGGSSSFADSESPGNWMLQTVLDFWYLSAGTEIYPAQCTLPQWALLSLPAYSFLPVSPVRLAGHRESVHVCRYQMVGDDVRSFKPVPESWLRTKPIRDAVRQNHVKADILSVDTIRRLSPRS